jgi:GNAT superfamily N-acetyltransferase
MDIRAVTDLETLQRGGHLFDAALPADAAARFLAARGHHLLFAWDEHRPIGFVSGVELTHPDKGTEMFVYELGVDDGSRRRGVAAALVEALASLARHVGCYGMWAATEPDNLGALRTYRRNGADEEPATVISWRF